MEGIRRLVIDSQGSVTNVVVEGRRVVIMGLAAKGQHWTGSSGAESDRCLTGRDQCGVLLMRWLAPFTPHG